MSDYFENSIILVALDRNYLSLFRNWKAHYDRLEIEATVVVVCFDDKSARLVEKNGFQVIRTNHDGDWLGFMRRQMEIMIDLLQTGYNILVSDLDAIWLSNPLPVFSSEVCSNASMIFSQGAVQPPSAVREWGFVLCTGFFYVRSTEESLRFFSEVKPRMWLEGDQPAINHILVNRGTSWEVNGHKRSTLNFNGQEIQTFDGILAGRCDDLSICLLPNSLFQRVPQESQKTIVIHPNTPKNQRKKITEMKRLGLWVY